MILRLVSFVGLLALLGIAWLLSERRKDVCWRTVATGVALQFVFGLLVLRTTPGRWLFEVVKRGFLLVINSSKAGMDFVFGPLVPADGRFVFFISVPCTLIFFASLMALLYHWGVMQHVVRAAAWVMRRTMRTSGRESLVAAANIFVGMTEAPLFVRPYLDTLTRSEYMALMTTGLATVAGTVMGLYASWGVSAGHLMTASAMSAPAALVFAKIMVPRRREDHDLDMPTGPVDLHERSHTFFEAVTNGARDGLMLSLNVCAMLIAVLSLIFLVNKILGFASVHAHLPCLTLEQIFGWIGWPMALLLGIAPADARTVGELLGTQVFCTELVAYQHLVKYAPTLSPRSVDMATYALCGFANLGSVAILIGGLSALAPSRKKDITELAWKSLVAGLFASYSTAAVAGMIL